jgi:gluconokinase
VHALAASVPAGSEGLAMLPYVLGERAPLWNPDLHGAFVGLRPQHTRAHLVRAALEGVCLQMRIIVDRLDGVEPVHAVRATGGVFRSPLWREVMAAALARSLAVLGRTKTLAAAVDQLSDDTASPPATKPDEDLVATYDAVRASVPAYVAALGAAAELLAPGRPPER